MKTSIALKTILASLLDSLGIVRWRLKKSYRDDFVIVMYHRILPLERAHEGIQPGMYVEPETFDRQIRFLKHVRIVPLSELLSYSREKLKRRGESKPLCALTFDDGWRDFYEYAFPVLKRHQVPASVFLPTDFIGTRKRFWTDDLASLLRRNNGDGTNPSRRARHSAHPLVGEILDLRGPVAARLEKAVDRLKPLREEEIRTVLMELNGEGAPVSEEHERSFLLWEEVREMAQSGLVSFGSHTAAHRILTTLTDEEVRTELIRSRETLIAQKAVDPSFVPFCYPNGNHNESIARMVADTGYALAVTTTKGWNRKHSEPFTLRRIGVHQDIASTESMFGCRIAEIF